MLFKYSKAVEEFLEEHKEGKCPSLRVQKWFLENKNLPKRTFQLYAHKQLLPQPKIVEGRNHFYTKEDFLILVDLVTIIRFLRDSPGFRFGTFQSILKKHGHSRGIVDKFLDLVSSYPIYVHDDLVHDYNFNGINALVWQKVIKMLEEGAGVEAIDFAKIKSESARWAQKRIREVMRKV